MKIGLRRERGFAASTFADAVSARSRAVAGSAVSALGALSDFIEGI
jgi:hypothetical protein